MNKTVNARDLFSQTSKIKIGKVTYIVTSHFKKNGRETAEQKLFRYVSDRVVEDLKSSETP